MYERKRRLLAFGPAILFLTLLRPTWAQQGTLSSLPTCALVCLKNEIETSSCAATNATCVCLDHVLQTNVARCVAENCTVEDSLVAQNVTKTACLEPVRDISTNYYALSISFGVVSATAVLFRLTAKFFTSATFGLDDLFIFITLLAGVPSEVLTVYGVLSNGLGRDIWTLTPKQITDFLRAFYFMEILYFFHVCLLKATLLFFYLRIFPGPVIQKLMWGTIIFNFVNGLVFVLLAIFPCKPISYYWTRWDGEHEGKCMNLNVLGWSNAVVSILLDFWMLALPLSQLSSLKMHWKKKLGVAVMFVVGTFVTVVSIIRLQSLVSFSNSQNPTWDNLPVSLWSTVEVSIGLICACMPTLRLVLVRLFPRSLGTTQLSRTRNNYYGTQGHTATAGTISVVRPKGKSEVDIPRDGIRYEQSFSVHHDDRWDHDESELIELGDFDSQKNGKTPVRVVARSAF
ncbi:hypothetical protein LZ554_001971 [Drepanopeziza brunnea f. sp. 'monogermtubi']|nr:hypothetical protein LZ554_001971 [Drepanopeziza brunnea f. sp. 'monogermtubi']